MQMFGIKKEYLLPLEKTEVVGDYKMIKEIKMLKDELKRKELEIKEKEDVFKMTVSSLESQIKKMVDRCYMLEE